MNRAILSARGIEVTTWGIVALVGVLAMLLTGEPVTGLAIGAGFAFLDD